MLEIVFIYRNAVVRLASEYPFRFDVHKALPLLEDKDIRNCIRSSSALKYGVGQPHRAEQFRPLCDISPYRRVFLVHRVARRDKGDDASRTHLVQRFCEEVIMDAVVKLGISFIGDFILPERHVADRGVKEIVRVVGIFISAETYGCALVKLLGDSAGK